MTEQNEELTRVHNATGLALVEMRLGQLEVNIDTLTKKFDVAISKLPTIDHINLILEPVQVQINAIVQTQRDIETDLKDLEIEFKTELKELDVKVQDVGILKRDVQVLREKDKTRESQGWQIKTAIGLAIFSAIVTPIVTLLISGTI